jgi:hypothetical protein
MLAKVKPCIDKEENNPYKGSSVGIAEEGKNIARHLKCLDRA